MYLPTRSLADSALYMVDFDLGAVRGAIDSQRQARNLSWAATAHQINRLDDGVAWKYKIATTSISKLGCNKSGIAEGDGMLQMLLWLGRSPESFVTVRPRESCKLHART